MNYVVVNGKKVDLDKAVLLGSYSYGTGNGDINYIYEAIYRTAKGNFVFFGEGGANTYYAEQISNNTRTGGKRLHFLKESEVIELLEKWGEEKAIIDNFADKLEEA